MIPKLEEGEEIEMGGEKYFVVSSARVCQTPGCGYPAISPHVECENCRSGATAAYRKRMEQRLKPQ